MAITIDYSNPAQYVINVPKADMLLVSSSPTEIRQLNINDFRLALNDLMDDAVPGIVFPTNHVHTAPLTISGVTLARVVEILNPYFIQFEDGLYNVNIVGGNSNISDQTIKNQVGVNTANSAGLQDPFALQASAFVGGEVTIDVTATVSGTTFPFGTRAFPVNNIADALAIASVRGISTFRILSDMTIGSGDFSNGYEFIGDNPNILVTLDSPSNVTNCEFKNMTIDGDLDGNNALRQCSIIDLNFFNGIIDQCGILGTIMLAGTNTAVINESYSLVPGGNGAAYACIDLGGAQTTPLVVRGWNGGLCLQNCTSQGLGADVSIDLDSGRVVFEASVVAGTFTVRGVCDVEDSSGPSATVNDLTLTKDVRTIRKHMTNKLVTNPTSGVAQLYDDDGTLLESAQLYEDADGSQTYRGQGAERREKFS